MALGARGAVILLNEYLDSLPKEQSETATIQVNSVVADRNCDVEEGEGRNGITMDIVNGKPIITIKGTKPV